MVRYSNVLGALTPKHFHLYSQPSFSISTWKRGGVWMCKYMGVIHQERLKIEVKLLSSANRKSYNIVASIGRTTGDLE